MAVLAEALVSIRPETRDFGGRLERDVRGSVDKAGKRVGSRFGSAFSGAFAGVATFFTVRKFFSVISEGFSKIQEVERLSAQTAAAIRSTGGAAGVTTAEVVALSESLENLSGTISAEAIQQGENLLLTFRNIRNEAGAGNDIFNQASRALLDFSIAMGTDARGGAVQLGKALNDPIRGITALSRAGVTFDTQQRNLIETLVKSGDTLGAQKIILAELNKEFGGSAAALGETFQGRIGRVSDKFEDLQKRIAVALVPALERLVAIGGSVAEFLLGLDPATIKLGISAIGAAGGLLLLGRALSIIRRSQAEGALLRVGEAIRGFGNLAGLVRFIGLGTAARATASALGAQVIGLARFAFSPLGLAITAASVILFGFIQRQRQARQRAEDYAAALKSEREGLKDATRQLIAHELAQRGAVEAARAAGVSLKELTGAIFGNAAARDALIDRLKEEQLEIQRHQRATDLSAAAQNKLDHQLGTVISAVKDLSAARTQGTREEQDELAVLKVAGPVLDKHVQSVKSSKTAYDRATEAIERFGNKVRSKLGAFVDLQAANDAVESGIDDLTESLKENGRTFDKHTEKGRANRLALRELVGAISDQVSALVASGKVGRADADQKDALIARIEKLKRRFPELSGQIDKYIGRVKAIPVERVTTLKVRRQQALEDFRAFQRKVRDETLEFGFSFTGTLRHVEQRRQHGGRLSGPSLVGERGVELFVPDTSGLVVSNNQLLTAIRALTAGAGGATQQIIVNEVANDPEATARAVSARIAAGATR